MKIPTHLPFIILTVGAAHALLITAILPRGEQAKPQTLADSTTLPYKTTGFIDESADEQELAESGLQRNPLNLMITEEEEVQVPVSDSEESGEEIKNAAALLFPITGSVRAEPVPTVVTAPEEEENESGFAVKEPDPFPEPGPPLKETAGPVLIVSADQTVNMPREEENVIPAPPVNVTSDVPAAPANENEEPPPSARPEPVIKTEEKILTTSDDIAEELLNSPPIDDPAQELDLSDTAVAAAMRKIERERRNATSSPVTPAAEKKIRVKVLTPVPLEGKPLKISPPPIPPSS